MNACCFGPPFLTLYVLAICWTRPGYRLVTAVAFPVTAFVALFAAELIFRPPFATVRPDPADVVGKWWIESDGRVRAYDPTKSSLDLRADGTFATSNMPGGGPDIGYGDWELQDTHHEGWGVSLKYADPFSGPAQPRYIRHVTINILHNAPPHELRYGVGDPDMGDHLLFRRR